MLSKKYVIIALIIIIFSPIIIFLNKDYLKHKLLISLPPQFQIAVQVISSPERVNHFKNDYNVNFIPNTQYINLNYEEFDLDFVASQDLVSNYSDTGKQISYKIDISGDMVYAVDANGNIRQFEITAVNGTIKLEKYKEILSNLKNINTVLDILIHNNELYVSYIFKNSNCNYLAITKANIETTPLSFKNIYESDNCVGELQAASMQNYNHKGNQGLLISTSVHTSEVIELAQDLNSILGKILFLDLLTNEINIFSSGHRSPQGLLAMNDLILSSEHGPRGGDELNKIEYKENYGWPISSYGEPYEDLPEPEYKKNHKLYGFKEPIYSFIPSIGISEIIHLPDTFSKHWKNNFILASLNNKSLFRIKFDNKFTKIIYMERIFIGKRIRDIKFYNKLNIILLAQQYEGRLGIIYINDN
jgi:hypothetical protein